MQFFLELNGISGFVQFHIKIPFVRLEARERKKRINIESNLITLERNSRKTNVGAATAGNIGGIWSCDNSIFSCNVSSRFSIKIKAIITNAIPCIVPMVLDVC